MEDLSVRCATPSDLEEILDLRLSLQRHLEESNPRIWRITEEGASHLRRELEMLLMEGEGRMVVAMWDGSLVGFAYGYASHRDDYLPPSVGYITLIYVREVVRMRGTGSRLVEELCQFFRSENVEDVTLRYTLGNLEAERFWRGLGFEPIIVTTNIRLEDLEERLMERPEGD